MPFIQGPMFSKKQKQNFDSKSILLLKNSFTYKRSNCIIIPRESVDSLENIWFLILFILKLDRLNTIGFQRLARFLT